MYLMYVDESGDPGILGSPTRYFILSGIVIHELLWKDSLNQLLDFRRRMKSTYGLKVREEIHASVFISRTPPTLKSITRDKRLAIIRAFTSETASINGLNIISVVVDKSTKSKGYDVFSMAWTALIQRFENTMLSRNFTGPVNPDERGLIFPDSTEIRKLRSLLRRLRHYNPIPSRAGGSFRNEPIKLVIEDPSQRNSNDSYFIQVADLSAFLLYQYMQPCVYLRSKGARNYFKRLEPVICKAASPKDPEGLGIVRI